MSNSSKISIVTPTFNRAWCIQRAINSVIKQTNPNWELVIIDDGSTDDTQEIVKKYIDPRIRYFYQSNQGVGVARNNGAAHATGEYVTFLDSDDELLPEAVETLCRDTALLCDGVAVILHPLKSDKYRNQNNARLNYSGLIKGKWPHGETTQLLRKEVFLGLQFPTIPGGMESIFWHSLLKEKGDGLIRTGALFIYHRAHSNRLTGRSSVKARARTLPKLIDEFINKFGDDYKALNKVRLGSIYFEKGVFELLNKDTELGRRDIQIAQTLNSKLRLVSTIAITLSHLPKDIYIDILMLFYRARDLLI